MPVNDKKLIERVISGTSNSEEIEKVVDWLSSSVEGQQCLSDRMDKDFYLQETLQDEGYMPTKSQSDRIFGEIERQIGRKRMRRIILKVAAVVLPLLLLGGGLFLVGEQVELFGDGEYAELYVPKGEKMHLMFQDGSEVFLNADSKISYPKKFGLTHRKIYLDGEAYFKVTPNKRRPFSVWVGNSSISVLGTSFNVNAYPTNKDIRVVLDEGRILFSSFGHEYNLKPGQKIVFDKSTGESEVTNLVKSSDESIWRRDYIRLNDTPLIETLELLDRQFDVNFNVLDDEATRYSFNLTTKIESLDAILNELHKITPIRFNRGGDTIYVTLSQKI